MIYYLCFILRTMRTHVSGICFSLGPVFIKYEEYVTSQINLFYFALFKNSLLISYLKAE